MPSWVLCLWVTSQCLWCATRSISHQPSRWTSRATAASRQCRATGSTTISVCGSALSEKTTHCHTIITRSLPKGRKGFRPTSSADAYAPPTLGALHATTSCVPTYARPRLPNSIQSVLAQCSCSRATVAYLNRSQPTSTSFVD